MGYFEIIPYNKKQMGGMVWHRMLNRLCRDTVMPVDMARKSELGVGSGVFGIDCFEANRSLCLMLVIGAHLCVV